MPHDQFIGNTPEDALNTFIEGWCRKRERDNYHYAYQHKRISDDPDDHPRADAKFTFTRKETLYEPTYRRYEGYIYELEDGRYSVEHWDSWIDRDSLPPKPPGQTPQRLKGRRPRDRRY